MGFRLPPTDTLTPLSLTGLLQSALPHKPSVFWGTAIPSPMLADTGWWYWMGLNHRPVAYKATALPIELQYHIGGDKVPNLPPVRQDPLKLDGACCGRCIQISSNLYRALFSILLLGRLLFLFCVHVQTSGLQSFNAASRIVILQPIARKEERRMGALAGFSHLSLIHHRNG